MSRILITCVFYQIWAVMSVFFIVFLTAESVHSADAALDIYSDGSYWLQLYRRSNLEILYFGQPGLNSFSFPVGWFAVKTGIPDMRPTPLPQRIGRSYWIITSKRETDNPETAPYFLELDIPVSDGPPYGPVPYSECGGSCDWVLPGAFGLHGVNGDSTKIALNNAGSSGCIRHQDRDIAVLYTLLNPDAREIRYYILDK